MAQGPSYRIGARSTASYPTQQRGGVTGRAPRFMPGALGARTAALKRAQGAGTPAAPPEPEQWIKCALDYLVLELMDKTLQGLLNIQQHARLPSYVDQPLSGIQFNRHRGFGSAASGDPGVVIPPGGAPTFVLDFNVPVRYRGVIRSWGVEVREGTVAARDLRWRLLVSNRRTPPFDRTYGDSTIGATAGGDWAGAPYSPALPGDLRVLLKSEDTVTLQALNFGGAPLTVGAVLNGWIYQPTIDEPGLNVRTTLTDQY